MSRKERADTTSILREVDSVWQKEGLDAVGIVESANPAPPPEQTASPEATIPRYLMVLLQRLIEEHRRGDVNQEEQAAHPHVMFYAAGDVAKSWGLMSRTHR